MRKFIGAALAALLAAAVTACGSSGTQSPTSGSTAAPTGGSLTIAQISAVTPDVNVVVQAVLAMTLGLFIVGV